MSTRATIPIATPIAMMPRPASNSGHDGPLDVVEAVAAVGAGADVGAGTAVSVARGPSGGAGGGAGAAVAGAGGAVGGTAVGAGGWVGGAGVADGGAAVAVGGGGGWVGAWADFGWTSIRRVGAPCWSCAPDAGRFTNEPFVRWNVARARIANAFWAVRRNRKTRCDPGCHGLAYNSTTGIVIVVFWPLLKLNIGSPGR
jgi:hypothetical protein